MNGSPLPLTSVRSCEKIIWGRGLTRMNADSNCCFQSALICSRKSASVHFGPRRFQLTSCRRLLLPGAWFEANAPLPCDRDALASERAVP